MFVADALARAALTANVGGAFTVEPTVNNDDAQASERLPDAKGFDGHWNTVRLMSGPRPVDVSPSGTVAHGHAVLRHALTGCHVLIQLRQG